MRVLVTGSGGREHALAWKLAQSDRISEVLVAPGNAGTAREPGVCNVPLEADENARLVAFAITEDVELVIPGPEAPLVAGLVDQMERAGMPCFGPTAAAARLEGSKVFSKEVLDAAGAPTAGYREFTGLEAALRHVEERPAPMVVKADGLAAGKGVIVAETRQQACAALTEMLEAEAFGDAGRRVLVEDFLEGEEASFIALVDGEHVLPLASSQDHKARDDGDRGPNTGGMGAYSPAPVLDPDVQARVMNEVMHPVVRVMRDNGTPFKGVLYAGLMISPDGAPRVLEFNVRFGDPECQPLMMRMRTDLLDLIEATREGRLDKVRVSWDPRSALGVVMASGGYPGSYAKGHEISGLDTADNSSVKMFHAGTAMKDGKVATAGGRVLCVTALGDSLPEARDRAYQAVSDISFEGAFHRSDIGARALARLPSESA
ncbi:MAG: phosphoribosylamine--glycine ligase [Gammaproteobacteria bacterium]|nr:phosphoribosylamine--glycine ligase [Gammaproteobacteria bacterium]MYH34749.1 phosphoribosylamine--glycine ligase [Gammaproteobacteria bacterium]MYL01106.1 phosphoribosylamine--glycine ligase [Gammaproteobacteria bacterium]